MLVSVDSSSTTETNLSIISHTLSSTSGMTRSSSTTNDGEVTETLTW